MHSHREIIQTTKTYIVSRETDPAHHEDPKYRGGYLILTPGRMPEIVLDGLATIEEQRAAEQRLIREVESMLYTAQTLSNRDVQQEGLRRELVRFSPTLIVSKSFDPAVHDDPRRRGGYLNLVPGHTPEIVLDGLAPEREQREAEQRCMKQLEKRDSMDRLQQMLHSGRRPPPHPSTRSPTPAHSSQSGQRAGSSRSSLPAGSSRSSLANAQASAMLIGQRLVQEGLVKESTLASMIKRQNEMSSTQPIRRIGSLLVEAGIVPMAQLTRLLSEKHGVQPIGTASLRVEPSLRALFAKPVLRRLEAAPVKLIGSRLVVAMSDPHSPERLSELEAVTNYSICPVQACQLQVMRLIDSMAG